MNQRQMQMRELPRAAGGATNHATHFVPAPYVASAIHGVHTALLDMRSERYYTLGEVGSRIWALITSGCSVGEIVERLGEEFDASTTQIEADLHALLARLQDVALIRKAGDTRTCRDGRQDCLAPSVGRSPRHGDGGEA